MYGQNEKLACEKPPTEQELLSTYFWFKQHDWQTRYSMDHKSLQSITHVHARTHTRSIGVNRKLHNRKLSTNHMNVSLLWPTVSQLCLLGNFQTLNFSSCCLFGFEEVLNLLYSSNRDNWLLRCNTNQHSFSCSERQTDYRIR